PFRGNIVVGRVTVEQVFQIAPHRVHDLLQIVAVLPVGALAVRIDQAIQNRRHQALLGSGTRHGNYTCIVDERYGSDVCSARPEPTTTDVSLSRGASAAAT